jgi:hypothetical protein
MREAQKTWTCTCWGKILLLPDLGPNSSFESRKSIAPYLPALEGQGWFHSILPGCVGQYWPQARAIWRQIHTSRYQSRVFSRQYRLAGSKAQAAEARAETQALLAAATSEVGSRVGAPSERDGDEFGPKACVTFQLCQVVLTKFFEQTIAN